jgi:prevent-host-death family protein
MEKTVNIHTAKTTLSKLIAEVEQGDEVVIARAGKPVAKLVAVKKKAKKARVVPRPNRRPGQMKGQIKILKGFYDPLPADMLAAMMGADD